jgi:D-alanyl-D-alanine carboxypeptidase
MKRLLPCGLWLALACAARPEPAAAPPQAASAGAPTAVAPAPGTRPTELALLALIDGLRRRGPDYETLTPDFAQVVRRNPQVMDDVARLGAVQQVVYRGPGELPGADVYWVTAEHGFAEWRIVLDPQGKIAGAMVRIKDPPPDHPLSRTEFVAAMGAYLEQEAAADRFAGTISIRKGDDTLFEGAYGLADRERAINNQLDTRFRIGSMNKMFTAVAVQKLAEARQLALTDPVGKYLPAYPNRELARAVTLDQLLTHSGGTGDIFGPEYGAHRLELKTLEDYVRLYGERPLEFEPGTRSAYSNYGFVLLGLVIAQASGQSYYDYVEQQIFRPVGMADTLSPSEQEEVPRRSRGYMRGQDGQLQLNDDTLPPRATSAGGGLSTVGDLQRFARALLEGRLISKGSLEALVSGRATPDGKPLPGFFQSSLAPRSFGHGGGAPGMNGDLRIYPDSGYVIAVLCNINPPSATRVAEYAADRLP